MNTVAETMRDSAEKRAKSMRAKAVSAAMKRKEEYLGARVPKELRDKVIRRAKDLGIPVSILIRNVLEEAFKETESVVVSSVQSTTGRSSMEQTDLVAKFASVLGWEDIMLNRPVKCSGCGCDLQSGATVTLGLGGGEHVVLCSACKERI